MIKIRDYMISEQIRCAICHADINNSSPIFQSRLNYGIICSKCMKLFNQEEIEITLSLFILYGGYFGQHKNEDFSVIDHLLKMIDVEGNDFNLESINMKLLHQSLIHGISIREFNQSLENFLKK